MTENFHDTLRGTAKYSTVSAAIRRMPVVATGEAGGQADDRICGDANDARLGVDRAALGVCAARRDGLIGQFWLHDDLRLKALRSDRDRGEFRDVDGAGKGLTREQKKTPLLGREAASWSTS
jgi:hypothetical protein